ncbi:MAG: Uma2 family endonuclease [Fibrella sp.]|nr:Uma2 family endonuclease [Armatimonadota bacterium]
MTLMPTETVTLGEHQLLPGSIVIPDEPGRVLYTREFLEFLEKTGILSGRYELLDGEIISKMGQNSPHNITVIACISYLLGVFPQRRVRSQATITVKQDQKINSPEPDAFVLREPTLEGAPEATNVLLAIEVSDTTQEKDFETKKELYARSGISEYWAIDLPRRTLTVLRNPDTQAGVWGSTNTLSETQLVASESAPDHPIVISELLPPVE